jgi:predicted dehydrogenase
MNKKNQPHALHTPIRVAMIGGGINSAIGRVHEIAMKMDNQFDLLAGCFSRNPQTNADTARQYNIHPQRVYPNAEHLLEAEAKHLDAVVIATPIESHAEYIHLALDHGLKVISDKPLLSNPAECQQLLQRISGTGTDVFSIFNYTGYPAVREMKARIENGTIGTVFKVMAEMPQDSYMRLKNQHKTHTIQQWRLHDGAVHCIALDLFVHLHSLIHFTCGKKPQTVNAWSRAISQVSPGLIDETDAIIHYEDNLLVNAWYGKAALGTRNGLRIRVFGTLGSLQWHQEEPELLQWATAEGDHITLDRISSSNTVSNQARYQRFKAGHPTGFIEAFANYYSDIAQALHEQQLNPYTLSTQVATEGLELAQAITQASHSGKTVQLNKPHGKTKHEHPTHHPSKSPVQAN